MRQASLFPKNKFELVHGGRLAQGRRKSLRPLARKHPLHLVLKSRLRLLKHREAIEELVRRQATLAKLRLYGCAVAADHVHLAVLAPGRREYRAFIRALTGLLARLLGKGLWILLPFSRVASWGRDFRGLLAYLRQNREEAEGLRPYEKRPDYFGGYL